MQYRNCLASLMIAGAAVTIWQVVGAASSAGASGAAMAAAPQPIAAALQSLARLQDESDPAPESALERMSRNSGALLHRETHDLKAIPATYGEPLQSSLLVIKDLLGSTGSGNGPTGGLVFSVKGEYSTREVFVDADEVEGLLGAVEFLEAKALALIEDPMVAVEAATGRSAELHYTTRDGLVLGVFARNEELVYAVRLGRGADWTLLTSWGGRAIKDRLAVAQRVLEGL